MTAEKIIERIKKDSEKEIKHLLSEVEKQTLSIIENAKKDAKQESEKILVNGKQEAENIIKISTSKASQDAKREIMNAREKIIDECFLKAQHELSTLTETSYKNLVKKLIEDGNNKLKGQCNIMASRDFDREIAKDMDLKVIGTVEATGGIIVKSNDGRITLDHTFDGILKRKKDEIRRKVGKLLFP